MADNEIYIFIGAGFGVVIIISIIFLILMCLCIRRRKASQLQDETESKQRPASEKVLIGKADKDEIATHKTEISPQNGSAASQQNTPNTTPLKTHSYEEIDIGSFPNQQNCMVEAISPPNDDADMKQNVATSPSQDEGVSTNGGPHLTEENYLYVFKDEVMFNQRNPDESDGMSDAVSLLNKDNVEESKMYVSADEVKLNKKQSNDTMKDTDMTSPSQNENGNKNTDLYVMNVAYASADEVAGVIKS